MSVDKGDFGCLCYI